MGNSLALTPATARIASCHSGRVIGSLGLLGLGSGLRRLHARVGRLVAMARERAFGSCAKAREPPRRPHCPRLCSRDDIGPRTTGFLRSSGIRECATTSPALGKDASAKKARSSSDEKRVGAAERFSYHQSAARSICPAALGEMRRAYVNDRATLEGEVRPRRWYSFRIGCPTTTQPEPALQQKSG